MPNNNTRSVKCSFCGKSQENVRKIVAGPGVYICDECVDLCTSIIQAEEYEDEEVGYTLNELDKIMIVKKDYIINLNDVNKYSIDIKKESIFDFVDLIIKKDKKISIK